MMINATQLDETPILAFLDEAPDLTDRSGGVVRSVDELDGESIGERVGVGADITAIENIPQRRRRGHEIVFDKVPGDITGHIPNDEREHRSENASYPDANDDAEHHVGEEPASQPLSKPTHCTPMTLVGRQTDENQPFDLGRVPRRVCDGERSTERMADEDEWLPASQYQFVSSV